MKLLEILKSPRHLCLSLSEHGFLNWMPDKTYLKLIYRCRMGKRLDLKHPTTFNEKLQWLKLYDRDPQYIELVDKILVRDHVREKIGEEYLIPLLGIWEDSREIDFDTLPRSFAIKCNHDSGSVILCRDQSDFDRKEAVCKLRKALKKNGFWYGREWPYKNVIPRIMAEELLQSDDGKDVPDFKVYCFSGEPKFVMVNQGRSHHQTTANYFDLEYHPLDFLWGYPKSSALPEMEMSLFQTMLDKARILAQGLTQIRVDFYVCNGKIYFGEMTFFDGSGFSQFDPPDWDERIGQWLNLPTDECCQKNDIGEDHSNETRTETMPDVCHRTVLHQQRHSQRKD